MVLFAPPRLCDVVMGNLSQRKDTTTPSQCVGGSDLRSAFGGELAARPSTITTTYVGDFGATTNFFSTTTSEQHGTVRIKTETDGTALQNRFAGLFRNGVSGFVPSFSVANSSPSCASVFTTAPAPLQLFEAAVKPRESGTSIKDLLDTEERHIIDTCGYGPAVAELNSMYQILNKLLPQLGTTAKEVLRLEEVQRKSKTLRERADTLESRMPKLVELRNTLIKESNETELKSNQVLGRTLTTQSCESALQQACENIKTLTERVMQTLPSDRSPPPPVPSKDSGNLLSSTIPTPLAKVIVKSPSDPPLSVKWLSEGLRLLQSCRLDECSKLVDNHAVLAQECSDLSSHVELLEKEHGDLVSSCKELEEAYQQSFLLQNALAGNPEYFASPLVRQKLCKLLPEALQTLMGLLAAQKTVSLPPLPLPQCDALPGLPCTSPSSTSSSSRCGVGALQVSSNEKSCIVCDERPRAVLLQPCGHSVLCSECAALVRKCPFCRSPIEDKQKLCHIKDEP
ncbi:hypothetical protein Pelo_18333 [Pelomyxa schiedti]|nr:hypothetical protein Pelo_18333 [Pelomyxa schiedti]